MHTKWTANALRELMEIQDEIGKDNPFRAFRVAAGINEQIEKLKLMPELGGAGRVDQTRELLICDGAYVVVFRMTGDVEILALRVN
ncbi:MAG: type II toxin-antitoxin system RelE/ParE family toxin [Pseudomonadota bacterium]